MQDLLSRLLSKSKQLGSRSLLGPPATLQDIKIFEESVRVILPENLKLFYLTFNGGCFADNDWSDKDLVDPASRESIYWNSNYFLTLSEMADAYHFNGKYGSMDLKEQEEATSKKLIPFLHTKGQELLIWDATDPEKTPILDAWHEVNADEWEIVYESVDALIVDYIDKEGEIETIA